jgi:extracellular factor (EF) 3-hydroxypalmitic acid methyl ester biosynthesis protein
MGEMKNIYEGQLIKDDESYPATLQNFSRFALLVKFQSGELVEDNYSFDNLKLKIESDIFELGKCKFISDVNINGYSGKIVFTKDIYDLSLLFSKKQVVNLMTTFNNLPLVIGYKDNITEEFKNFTATVNYDANVYKHFFDDMDKRFSDEPDDIKREVEESIIKSEGRKFFNYLDNMLVELNGVVSNFSREEHEKHGYYFRRQLWNILMCSEFMKRSNVKPRGYAGDSEMMNMLYRREYEGDSTFKKLLHRHPIERPAAQAVRNRRKIIAETLDQIYNKTGDSIDGKMKVLSVACGPAFELHDIIKSKEDADKYSFSLLDQDRDALGEAAGAINAIQNEFSRKLDVEFIIESVRTLLMSPQFVKSAGQFHFIYSMGLFDYLTPPTAKAVFSKLYEMLMPGGEIVIGNYHIDNPDKWYMEYWHDWVLYYRTEEDMLGIVADDKCEKDIMFDGSKAQMFLKVKKSKSE